jgi:enoyl-CoA hydratase/carnithine racemase
MIVDDCQTDEGVRVERQDGCAWVTLDRPPLNLFTIQTLASLRKIFALLARDESVRIAVIGGAGPHMTAGMQLEEMRDLTVAGAEALIDRLRNAIQAVYDAPFPTIAMVHGVCLGAGFELVMACDLRVLADDARLGLPEVRVGIPSVIHAALLPSLIGAGRAAELLFTGETIDAQQAQEWGLANRVLPRDQLLAETERVVGSILRCGPQAIRLQKELIIGWRNADPRTAIDAGVHAFGRAFATDEPREGMQAFLEKRKPEFG